MRDPDNPKRPWIPGDAVDVGRTRSTFVFNKDKKGWHYGWASNKHSCNALHVLQAYVMVRAPDNASTLVVQSVTQSPSFMVFCRRRRRFSMVPSAPIAPPKRPRGAAARKAAEAAAAAAAAAAGGGGDEDDADGDDDDEGEDDDAEDEEDDDARPPAKRPRGKASAAVPAPAPATATTTTSSTTTTTTTKAPIRAKRPSRSGAASTTSRSASTARTATTAASSSIGAAHAADLRRLEMMIRAVAKHVAKIQPPPMATTSSSPATTATSVSRAEVEDLEPLPHGAGAGAGHAPPPPPPRLLGAVGLAELGEDLTSCIDMFADDSLLEDFDADFPALSPTPAPLIVAASSAASSTTVVDKVETGSTTSTARWFMNLVSGGDASAPSLDALPPSTTAAAAATTPPPTRVLTRDELLTNLGNFLIDEREFTDAIHELAAANTSTGGSEDDASRRASFERFVSILRSVLTTFMERQGLSQLELDRALLSSSDASSEGSSSNEGGNSMQLMSGRLYGGGARGAFDHIVEEVRKARRSEGPGSSSFASAAAAASAAEFAGAGATSASSTAAPPASPTTATARVLGPFTGSWELDHTLDHEQADRLEALRQELGEPWLLRRMIRYMEERFSVEQTAEHMTVRMRRKLLSSGVMTLELDGAEHEWGMSLPMFQGLSRQWKYRAWIDDVGRVHHVHDVGVTDRMRRVLELVDVSRMKISAVLELSLIHI